MKNIDFLLSVETTSRWVSNMSFDFGNNMTWQIPLQESGDSMIQHQKWTGTSVNLVAGYGQTCTMKLLVSHFYSKEGQYLPSATVKMGQNKLHKQLSKYLYVQQKIQGVSIERREAVPTNTNTNFTAVIEVPSENMTFQWLLEQGNGGSTITRNKRVFFYNFPSVGLFHLSVNVSNLHGAVIANITFRSQDRITGLTVKTLKPVVKVGETIQCEATITSGTKPDFKWQYDLSEDRPIMISDLTSSYLNITYEQPGEYNITVSVKNKVSHLSKSLPKKISVQEAVGGVEFEEVDPIMVNYTTTFTAYMTVGSHIKCNFTFGNDIVTVFATEGSHNCSTEYTFLQPGVTTVNVIVYNGISSITETIEVIVQLPIGDLIVNNSILVSQPSREDQASSVFFVLSKGKSSKITYDFQ